MLGNACGLRVLGLSCISNYAAGLGPGTISHADVTGVVDHAVTGVAALFSQLWKSGAFNHDNRSNSA